MFSMRIEPCGGGENGDPRQVSVFDAEIIDEVEQSPRKNIASEFGIPQSTLSTILTSCVLPMSLAGLNESVAENLLDLKLMLPYSSGLQPQGSSLFRSAVRF